MEWSWKVGWISQSGVLFLDGCSKQPLNNKFLGVRRSRPDYSNLHLITPISSKEKLLFGLFIRCLDYSSLSQQAMPKTPKQLLVTGRVHLVPNMSNLEETLFQQNFGNLSVLALITLTTTKKQIICYKVALYQQDSVRLEFTVREKY